MMRGKKIMGSKKRKGFTLIELIVVIAILGILAAIAIPRLSGFQTNAKFKADVSTARVIATAAATFYATDPTKNYIGATGGPANSAALFALSAFDDLLPQDNATATAFDNKTQFDGTVYVVGIDSNGNVTVTAGSTQLYPNPPSSQPSGGDYTP